MMDPGSMLRMMTPAQQAQIAQMQAVTSRIRASIHTEDGKVSIAFTADDPEATQAVPQVVEAIVTSVANSLYQIFGVQGVRL